MKFGVPFLAIQSLRETLNQHALIMQKIDVGLFIIIMTGLTLTDIIVFSIMV
jgi:hypothetical protein